MAITNLTNTKWVLNSSLNLDFGVFTYNINFISNNTNYTTVEINGTQVVILKYGSTNVYTELNSWSNQAYRIIEITGGIDVTNTDLIQWLEANATQVDVSDLTGTTWVFNPTIEYNSNFPTYTINYKAYYNNGANYEEGIDLRMASSHGWYGLVGMGLSTFYGWFFPGCIYESETTTTMAPTTNGETLDYIEITNGTDATNPDLIVWLSQNATLQQPVTPVKTFDLSTLQLSAGTHVVQVKARATGYRDSNFSNSVSYVVTPPQWSCVVAGLGSENPSNVTFTHTGTMPTFEEVTVNSNVFIKIPKMYRKVLATSNNQITSFEIANYKKDNDFMPYTCFVKEDGITEMDYVLIGKYYSNSSSVMNSVNTTVQQQTITNGRTNARALGTGYQLFDWQMQKLWQDLIICKKNTINTNSGTGISGNNYDAFGIYWGRTGSNSSSWIDGVMGNYGNWKFSYKPSEYASETVPNTYIQASYSRPNASSGAVKKLGYDSFNPFFNYPSSINSGDVSIYNYYYCDSYNYSNGVYPVYYNVNYPHTGYGAFFCLTNLAWSDALCCVRLCYRPIFTQISTEPVASGGTGE